MIRIVLADDHPVFTIGLAATLSMYPNIEVIGHAKDGADAICKVKTLKPDILVLGLRMRVLNGFEVIRKLKAEMLPVKCIVVSMHETDSHILYAIKCGAVSYLSKNEDPSVLADTISQVYSNDTSFSEAVEKLLYASQPFKNIAPPDVFVVNNLAKANPESSAKLRSKECRAFRSSR